MTKAEKDAVKEVTKRIVDLLTKNPNTWWGKDQLFQELGLSDKDYEFDLYYEISWIMNSYHKQISRKSVWFQDPNQEWGLWDQIVTHLDGETNKYSQTYFDLQRYRGGIGSHFKSWVEWDLTHTKKWRTEEEHDKFDVEVSRAMQTHNWREVKRIMVLV